MTSGDALGGVALVGTLGAYGWWAAQEVRRAYPRGYDDYEPFS